MFHATWTSTLVAGLLLAVVWIGRRWPAQVRYGLILIALIKFAVPPTLAVPVGVFSQFGPTILERSEPLASSEGTMGSQAGNSAWPAILSAWGELNWRAWLMLLHLIGCALLGIWTIFRLAKVAGIARRAKLVTSGRWHKVFAPLVQRLVPGSRVSLLLSSEAVPPIAFGLFRPRVMVSMSVLEDLPLRQIRTILAHELAHHRRADIWVNALQSFLGILWWFNPLVRVLNQILHRIREDCCDDLLLCRNLTTDGTYCQTLLRTTRNLIGSSRPRTTLGFAQAILPLGQRIQRIMDPQVHRLPKLSLGTTALMIVVALLLLPGLSSRHSDISETPSGALAPSEPLPGIDLRAQLSGLEEVPGPPDVPYQARDLAHGLPGQVGGIPTRSNLPLNMGRTTRPRPQPDALIPMHVVWSKHQGARAGGLGTAVDMPISEQHRGSVNDQIYRRNGSGQSALSVSSVSDIYDTSTHATGQSGSVMVAPRPEVRADVHELTPDGLPGQIPIPLREPGMDGPIAQDNSDHLDLMPGGASQEWKSELAYPLARNDPAEHEFSSPAPAKPSLADGLSQTYFASSMPESSHAVQAAVNVILPEPIDLPDLAVPDDVATLVDLVAWPDIVVEALDPTVLSLTTILSNPIGGLEPVDPITITTQAASGGQALVLASAVPATDPIMVAESAGLVDVLPGAVDLASFLGPGSALLAPVDTIPEPLSIWALAAAGLLLVSRRKKPAEGHTDSFWTNTSPSGHD